VKEITLLGFGYLGYHMYCNLKNEGCNIKIISPATWYTGLLDQKSDYVEMTPEILSDKKAYYRMLDDSIKEKSTLIYAIGSINATTQFDFLAQDMQDYYIDFFETIKICNSKDVENFVFFSSGGTIYGDNTNDFLSELDPPNPINIYGLQKLCFEQMLKINREEGGCPYLITRISNPYGGRVEPERSQGIISVVLNKLKTNSTMETWVPDSTTRDYIYISDMCKSITELIKNNIKDDVFNVASGKGVSNKEIYDLCEKITGKKLERKSVENHTAVIPRNVLDVSRIKSTGCLISEVSFEEGIKKFAEQYK